MTGDITTLSEPPTKWMNKAACRGSNTNMFYPNPGEPSTPARQICDTCPVAVECLEYAINNGERYGIWGGTPVRKRRDPARALSALKQRIAHIEFMKLDPKDRRKKLAKKSNP